MDVETYITDNNINALARILWHTDTPDPGEKETAADHLRGLLPGILAQHRADVEAGIAHDIENLRGPHFREAMLWAATTLHCSADVEQLKTLADEAVGS